MAENDEDLIFSDEDDDIQTTITQSASKPKKAPRNRPKVSTEWNDETTSMLISAVESTEFLWNPGHKDYKNRHLRENMWNHIAENIFNSKHTGDQLNAKLANLRIQFKSYYTKSKETKSGQGAVHKAVSWKVFNQMLFVKAAENAQSTVTESNMVSTNFIYLYWNKILIHVCLYCHSTSPSLTKYS